MAWKFWPQPQHRGVQLPRSPVSDAPAVAVVDRSAQDHDLADVLVTGRADPGPEFPAGSIETSHQDNTPTLPQPHARWDEQVQPEPLTITTKEV